jgi:hypothetical protein
MALSIPSWLDTTPVDHYCERTSEALSAEPINALTNIAFLVAASAAWTLLRRHPDAKPHGQLTILATAIAIVGLGSMLFHTVGQRWAEWGDIIPIGVFLALALWLFLGKFLHVLAPVRLILVVGVVGSAFYLDDRYPKVLAGGLLYVPILIALVVLTVALLRAAPKVGWSVFWATSVWCVSLAARFADLPFCESFPVGTHFLWHLLNSVVLYLFAEALIEHESQS